MGRRPLAYAPTLSTANRTSHAPRDCDRIACRSLTRSEASAPTALPIPVGETPLLPDPLEDAALHLLT